MQRYAGNFGGVAAADQICADRAAVGGLKGTFLAWLSDGTEATNGTRLQPDYSQGNPAYYMLDGTKVADSFVDFLSENLLAPIGVTELLTVLGNDRSYTGLNGAVSFGPGPGVPSDSNCDGWTNSSSDARGLTGRTDLFDRHWTQSGAFGCNNRWHIYCFEAPW